MDTIPGCSPLMPPVMQKHCLTKCNGHWSRSPITPGVVACTLHLSFLISCTLCRNSFYPHSSPLGLEDEAACAMRHTRHALKTTFNPTNQHALMR